MPKEPVPVWDATRRLFDYYSKKKKETNGVLDASGSRALRGDLPVAVIKIVVIFNNNTLVPSFECSHLASDFLARKRAQRHTKMARRPTVAVRLRQTQRTPWAHSLLTAVGHGNSQAGRVAGYRRVLQLASQQTTPHDKRSAVGAARTTSVPVSSNHDALG